MQKLQKKKEKIIILGSNSFSANTCASYLMAKNYKVFGVSRPRYLHPKYNAIQNLKNFTNYKFDLNKDLDRIFELITKIRPDYIIDFAAQGMVAQSWNSPEYWFQTNVLSKVKLQNFLVGKKFLKKYINISTPEVYGNYKGKLKTNNSIKPSTPYAVTKASIDLSLHTFYEQYNFPVVTGRFANFYGPYQTLYRIVPLTIHKAFNKDIINLHGGGKAKRYFIYSDDFSNAIYKMILKGRTGSVYHFSADQIISIKELVKIIYKKLNLNYKNYINVTQERPGKDSIYDMYDNKSRIELNWKNNFTLDQGLDNTIKWYNNFNHNFSKRDERYIVKK